ncbi:MAG: hypothetical protein JRD89_20460 [Deltaproteobacteria bacterium]|nr:hypothetical protein [Deltaproteobacteria bacterium]
MKRPKERVWTYIGGADLEYVEAVQRVLGLESKSETLRFIIRLCKLMVPRADIVNRIVLTALQEELNPKKVDRRS